VPTKYDYKKSEKGEVKMPNNLSTLSYRTSILTRLQKIVPLVKQADISRAYEILDHSSDQQLNRYWALITSRDYETLRKEFNADN
jgi:hypothetical protein